MKIKRANEKIIKELAEIKYGETFLYDNTPFMRVNTEGVEVECCRCEDIIELETNYAVNLETGDLVQFGFYSEHESCNCEVVVDR